MTPRDRPEERGCERINGGLAALMDRRSPPKPNVEDAREAVFDITPQMLAAASEVVFMRCLQDHQTEAWGRRLALEILVSAGGRPTSDMVH